MNPPKSIPPSPAPATPAAPGIAPALAAFAVPVSAALVSALVLAFALVPAPPARADNIYWEPDATGTWFTTGGWRNSTPDGATSNAPDTADTARVASGHVTIGAGVSATTATGEIGRSDTAQSGTVTVAGLWRTTGILYAGLNETGAAPAGTGVINIASTGTLIAGTDLQLGYHANSTGVLTIAGTASVANLTLSASAGSGGTLDIDGGALTTTGGVIYIGNSGTATVTVDGGRWNNTTGLLFLGLSGTAALTITSSGTLINTPAAYLGFYAGSSGSASVAGLWQNTGNLFVGNSGSGALTIERTGTLIAGGDIQLGVNSTGILTIAGTASAGNLTLGANANSTGTLTITGTASAANLTLAANASSRGTLNIDGGALTTTGNTIYVGSAGTAAVTVDGGRWNNTAGYLFLGVSGTATLTITGSGTLINTPAAYLGFYAGSSGSASVAGLWQNTGNIIVGSLGSGALTIERTGTLIAGGDIQLGANANSTGTLTITGTASAANLTLAANASSRGTLNIDGGALTTTGATIYIGSSGTATVTVDGGRWNNTAGYLFLGVSGTAALTITGSGTLINTPIAYLGYQPGSSGSASVAGLWQNTNYIIVGNSGTGALTIERTGTLAIATSFLDIADQAAGTGTVTVHGLLTAPALIVGNRGHGTLDIRQGGTAATIGASSYVSLGYYANTGAHGTATIAGHLQNSGFLQIASGASSTGFLDIIDTGTVTNGTFTQIAYGANTSGTIHVAGLLHNTAAAAATATLYIGVGASSNGFLDITNTGTVINGNGEIANNSTATGTATVAGLWRNAGSLTVGAAGRGTLNITSTIAGTGTVTSVGAIIARDATAASSSATVAGLWTNTGNFIIGQSGSGTLDIAPGGTVVSTGWVAFGLNSGVAGTGSIGGHLRTDNTLYAGVQGDGIITITGTVDVAGITTIGDRLATGDGLPDASGRITVAGLLNTTGNLAIGNNSAGTLDILAGGTVTNASGILASGLGATGTATVAGYWNSTGNLFNGVNGAATLAIAGTGTVATAAAYSQNARSTLAVTLAPGRTHPHLTAAFTAALSGTLRVDGFEHISLSGVTKASELAATTVTILRAPSGITGDFDRVLIAGAGGGGGGGVAPPDYISPAGYKVAAGGIIDNEYRVGYGLSWQGTRENAHGTFTLPDGETFEVDVPLADRAGDFVSGWDGKSLTKAGPGTLVLSANNTFTGALTINAGTIKLAGAPDVYFGALHNDGILDFNNAQLNPVLAASPAAGAAAASAAAGATAGYGVRRPVAAFDGATSRAAPDASAITNPSDTTNPSTPAGGQINLPVQSGDKSPHSINTAASVSASASAAASAPARAFRTVTAASLAGTGTFRMTVDLAAGDSDRLIILGDAAGAHRLLITGAGAAPTGDEPRITLVTIGGVDGSSFDGSGELPDGTTFEGGFDYGAFNYQVQIQGNKVALASTGLTPAAYAPIRGIPGAQSAMWFAQQDNLAKRLGELRAPLPREGAESPPRSSAATSAPAPATATGAGAPASPAPAADAPPLTAALWLRARAERATIDARAGRDLRPFTQDLVGAELGADLTWRLPASRATLGVFAGQARATQDFDPATDAGAATGESTLLGGGLYAAWLGDAGWFANLTLTAGRYENTFAAADQSGNLTTADYRDTALGASLETGLRIRLGPAGWFLEPALQATRARLARGDYHTAGANILSVRGAAASITRARAHLRAGRAWRTARLGWLELALRAAATRERSDGGEISIGQTPPWRPNLDGDRFEAGAALAWQPTDTGQLYFDYEAAAGANYKKPWGLSLGYRHMF